MHFVRQKLQLVLRAYADVMHYGPRAQMIHEKKRAHMHVIWGVKTGISLNYYYGEGEVCTP